MWDDVLFQNHLKPILEAHTISAKATQKTHFLRFVRSSPIDRILLSGHFCESYCPLYRNLLHRDFDIKSNRFVRAQLPTFRFKIMSVFDRFHRKKIAEHI